MNKFVKKSFALLLVIVMVIGLMPAMNVFAEDAANVTVTYSVDGEVFKKVDTAVGEEITLEEYTGEAPAEGYVFEGWSAVAVKTTDKAPALLEANDAYQVPGEITLHAVFSYEEEATGGSGPATWEKVTAQADLTSGKYVMVVNGGYAPTTVSSGWLQVTNVASKVSGTQFNSPASSNIVTLTVSGTSVKIMTSDGKFIAPSAGNNNGIQNKEYSWTMAWKSADSTVQFKGVGSDTTTLASNKGSSYKMRAYKNSTVSGNATSYPSYFTMYKETVVAGAVTYYATHTACDHANTTNTALAPECLTAGYTAGTVCTDCGAVLSGCQWIAPTGHNYEGVPTPPTMTYTCTECGDTYQGELENYYTVSFAVPDGAEAVENKYVIDGEPIELPVAESPIEGYTFQGWVTETVDNVAEQPAEILKAGEEFTTEANVTLKALYSYVVVEEGATETVTKKYTFASYAAGTQFAKDEEHVLDDMVTVVTNDAHFTTQLRLYSSSTNNGYAIIKTAGVSAMSLNAGNNADTLNVYGSNDDGANWTLIQGVTVASSYKDYSVNFGGKIYKWLKLDVAGSKQLRVQHMTLTLQAPPTETTYYTTELPHVHSYAEGETVCACGVVTAKLNDVEYTELAMALDASADVADVVTLVTDVAIEGNLDVYCTLDLAGYSLTVSGKVDACNEGAHVVDSQGDGAVAAGELLMYPSNDQLAIDVNNDGVVSYETVQVKQKNYAVAENKTKVSFYINKLAADTKLDDAILAGADVKIRLTVNWTEDGTAKSHSFVYSQELVNQYLADWDGKMFNCTITGLNELNGAQVTAEVVSCGVVLQAFVVA